jgi:hypothetical protein
VTSGGYHTALLHLVVGFFCDLLLQGTSAPIAIPNMMNRWRSDSKSGAGQQEAASTFIPPHQLSKQDDFMFRCAAGCAVVLVVLLQLQLQQRLEH